MESISSSLGIGKRYFIVILLIARLSTHIRHVPSFFGVNNVGTVQGLKLSRMNSLLNNSSTCLCRHVPSGSSDSAASWVEWLPKLDQLHVECSTSVAVDLGDR